MRENQVLRKVDLLLKIKYKKVYILVPYWILLESKTDISNIDFYINLISSHKYLIFIWLSILDLLGIHTYITHMYISIK